MTRWKALYKTSRPINLLIIGLTMYAVRYGMNSRSCSDREFIPLPDLTFFLLVLSIILLAAAGNIINDYFDQEADLVNKPGQNLIGIQLSSPFTLGMYKAITVGGILSAMLGMALASPMDYSLLLFNFLIAASLWIYSKSFMKKVLLGNVLVSILVASLPFLVYQYEVSWFISNESAMGKSDKNIMEGLSQFYCVKDIIFSFCFFAFTVNMARELTKDIQDLQGDKKAGYRTLAVTYGVPISLKLILFFILLTGLGFCYMWWTMLAKSDDHTLLHLIILGAVNSPLLLAALNLMKKAPSASSIRRASALLKLSMLLGILSLFSFGLG